MGKASRKKREKREKLKYLKMQREIVKISKLQSIKNGEIIAENEKIFDEVLKSYDSEIEHLKKRGENGK